MCVLASADTAMADAVLGVGGDFPAMYMAKEEERTRVPPRRDTDRSPTHDPIHRPPLARWRHAVAVALCAPIALGAVFVHHVLMTGAHIPAAALVALIVFAIAATVVMTWWIGGNVLAEIRALRSRHDAS